MNDYRMNVMLIWVRIYDSSRHYSCAPYMPNDIYAQLRDISCIKIKQLTINAAVTAAKKRSTADEQLIILQHTYRCAVEVIQLWPAVYRQRAAI